MAAPPPYQETRSRPSLRWQVLARQDTHLGNANPGEGAEGGEGPGEGAGEGGGGGGGRRLVGAQREEGARGGTQQDE